MSDPTGPGKRTRRIGQGWNRSQTVWLLKVLLPTVAFSLVALVITWSHIRKTDGAFKVGVSLVQPEDAHNLRMVNARYAGRSRSKQPYLVTASTALQDRPNADVIHLVDPKGDITMKSGAWVALTAPKGDYLQGRQMLDLAGGVTLFHDSGLEFNSDTAHIDLKQSTAMGTDPVTGHGPAADITSQGFKVFDSGQRVIFTGKAHLTLYRKAKTPTAAERNAKRKGMK